MSNFEILDQAWAQELQATLADYIDTLIFGLDTDEEEDEYFDTVTGLPFCGCDVCHWREVLAFVTPRLLEGARDGKVQLVSEEE